MSAYRGIPPHSGSQTSYEAAVSKIGATDTERQRVLEFLRRVKFGATDEQIHNALGMPQNTERPRRRELVLMGAVADSGKRRRTMSGRNAIVWEIKQAQLRLL